MSGKSTDKEVLEQRMYNRTDSSTLSNYLQAISTAIVLDWTIDFDEKVLSGKVTHSVRVLSAGTATVDFDSSKLSIESVTVNGETSEFILGEPFSDVIGSRISIPIPESLRKENDEFEVTLNYRCSKEASAIQWLEPAATKGGLRPFVFTQSQAIHARSLLPCQDSPGVKTPYKAIVRCPEWCTVLMSALNLEAESSAGRFSWSQPVPTAAYLIALAAGELASRDISERVRIWAEPEVVDSAAYEFAETEAFLSAAESLTCPYMWKRYDVLCLPPSFPYGGMENPCLTFATPTLLAGDRSLADVIAHEIAHSWTGNLVTNATWEHFWLNEGWTVWLERNIMAKVKGSRDHQWLSSQIGWEHLRDDVNRFISQESGSEFTQLIWPLEQGADPDDAFSSVPYEKGYNFLLYLERIVGSEPFGLFVKNYLLKFSFATVTTGEFRDFFMEFFRDSCPAVKDIDWDLHCFSTGMPLENADFSNALSAAAESLSDSWLALLSITTESEELPGDIIASKTSFADWSSQQKCVFLESLLAHTEDSGALPARLLLSLDSTYSLSLSNNAEIKLRWQRLCLKSEVEWIVPHVVSFITSQGRMKFVRPLYRALAATSAGKSIASDTFATHNQMYHPIARKMLANDLGVNLSGK